MTIYNIIFICIIVGLLVQYTKIPKVRAKYFFALSSLIILTVALRGKNIAGDTHNYLDFFLNPNSKNIYYQASNIEPGLTCFNALVRLIWANKYFYLFFIALFSNIPIFLIFRKFSINPFLSIFLFVSFSIGNSMFIIELAALRQCLALSFYAWAIYFYASNNFKFNRWVILFLVLMFFTHYTSLLGVLLFAFTNIKFSKKQYYVISIIFLVMGFFIERYAQQMFVISSMFDKEFYLSNYGQKDYSIVPLFPYWGYFMLMIYFMPKKRINSFWIKGFFFCILLSGLFFCFGGNNLDRMCTYYYLPALIALPQLFKLIQKKAIIHYALLITLIGYFSYKYFLGFEILASADYSPIPYKSFLSEIFL